MHTWTSAKGLPTEIGAEIKHLCKKHESRIDASLASKSLSAACRDETTAWIDSKRAPAGFQARAPKANVPKTLLAQPVDESMVTLRAYIATRTQFQNEDGSLKNLTVEEVLETFHSHYISSMTKIRSLASADAATKASAALAVDPLLDELSLLAAEVNAKAVSVFGGDVTQPIDGAKLEELKTDAKSMHAQIIAKRSASSWSKTRDAQRRAEHESAAKELAANMPPDRAMHTAIVQSVLNTLRKTGQKISADTEAKILKNAMSSEPPNVAKIADSLARGRGRLRSNSRSQQAQPRSRSLSKRRSDSSADSRPPKRFRSLSSTRGKATGRGKGSGKGRGRGGGKGRGNGKGRG
jgi:hypothetical protein